MKLPMLSAFAWLLGATAFGQTSTATPPVAAGAGAQPTQAITLSGCVGGGTNAQPFVLNNAMVLPQSGAGATGGAGTGVTGAGAPGTTGVGATGATGVGATPAATPPSTAGTTGAATPSGAAGTTGTAGAPGTGTTGVGTAGTTGATGSGGSAMSGYRLSGTDMSGWTGQRVQIVGTVVPAADAGSPTPGTVPIPEFRVQSVQPLPGACPQP
jgi:hypothetical protein